MRHHQWSKLWMNRQPKSSDSETSIEITEPTQSIVARRQSDTSRTSRTYEIDDTDLGVTKLDKGQVLYLMYTICEHKEKWDTRVEHMEHRLKDDIKQHLDFPVIRRAAYPITLFRMSNFIPKNVKFYCIESLCDL
jgi:hypothetical protein